MGARTWGWETEWVLEEDGSLTREWRRVVPRIQEELLDSVVYLYPSRDSAKGGDKIGGSGFIIGVYSRIQETVHLYVVTNRHVIRDRDGTPNCQVVRMTSRVKPIVIRATLDKDWITPDAPDNDDLALWHLGTQPAFQDRNYSFISADICVTDYKSQYFVGADTFMLGRFISRDGRQRNTPTARFGNVSMLPNEPLEDGTSAFFVETRSQSGYSGSPVFIYEEQGMFQPHPNHATRTGRQLPTPIKERFTYRLLGIDRAHVQNVATVKKLDSRGNLTQEAHRHVLDGGVELGSGMLVVVPAWKLTSLLNREDVRKVREEPPVTDHIEEEVAHPDSLSKTADLVREVLKVPPKKKKKRRD